MTGPAGRPSLFERLRRLLEVPTQLDRLESALMANLDTLQAAAERTGAAVREAVVLVPDLRAKLAAAEAELASGRVDQERLAAIIASLDADTDALAGALNPVVEEPEVPTGDAEPQPETNPETQAPEDVPGSVPAGEPLPEQV